MHNFKTFNLLFHFWQLKLDLWIGFEFTLIFFVRVKSGHFLILAGWIWIKLIIQKKNLNAILEGKYHNMNE